jgi:hypothetical protein
MSACMLLWAMANGSTSVSSIREWSVWLLLLVLQVLPLHPLAATAADCKVCSRVPDTTSLLAHVG